MKTIIRDITEQCHGRMIVVSDVHGYGHYLKGLLEKVQYTQDDTLIIVGDLIEKGGNSLETVRYVMQLKKENPKVHVLAGNVDADRIGSFLDQSEGHEERFLEALRWTKKVWKRGLFLDMLAELGITVEEVTENNVAEVKEKIRTAYREEIELLWEIPTILICGNYLFVHGGIPTENLKELEKEDAFRFMKVDAFMEQPVAFRRCVVVGHWPVCLYQTEADDMNPMFDYEKRIISIDGGCALKIGEQLNALLIPEPFADMKEIMVDAYDDYPEIYAKKAQAAQTQTICLKYFDAEVEVLEEKEDVVVLRHKSSGVVFDAPESYLYHRGEKIFCNDFTNLQLEICEGDVLKVIVQTSVGAIVKKEGRIGWYRNK